MSLFRDVAEGIGQNSRPECPTCGMEDWAEGANLVLHVAVISTGFKVVAFKCNNCSFVRFHAPKPPD